MPEGEARLILGENAIRFYGVDLGFVESVAEKFGPEAGEILAATEVPSVLVTEFEKRGGFLKDAPALVQDRLDAMLEEALAPSTGA